MNVKEAFKLGFLSRCADEGLTPDETRARIRDAHAYIKQANPFGDAYDAFKGVVGSGLSTAAGIAKPLAIAGPPLAGAGVGYALAKANEEEVDPEEAKKQELLAEYQRVIDRARNRKYQLLTH